MAYDEKLAERIRAELEGLPFAEKKMFGGVAFLVHGNMACGIGKDNLMVRVDRAEHAKLLQKPHTKPSEMAGRPMKGWLLVEPEGVKTKSQLEGWVKKGVDFALTLPPK